MRAYSSLIGHILGSHHQINGYFEMHMSYEDSSSVDKQLALFLQTDQIKTDSCYLFDKLLHNDYMLATELFESTGYKLLVSLRQPEQTIKSIVNLFIKKEEPHPYANIELAVEYYINRLQWLGEFCSYSSAPYFYFDADSIQKNSQHLLTELGNWLQLDSPLSSQYTIFNRTGLSGAGDSSEHIFKGEINQKQNEYHSIVIPEAALKSAVNCFQEVRNKIILSASKSILTYQ